LIRTLAIAAAMTLLAVPAFAQTTATSPAPKASGMMKGGMMHKGMKGGSMSHGMKGGNMKGGSMKSGSMKGGHMMASPAPKPAST